MIILLFILLFSITGCSAVISELSDSSGCVWAEGGPTPGFSNGEMILCRSGKDKASVFYRDTKIEIRIIHK